jgi:hypothetical protein
MYLTYSGRTIFPLLQFANCSRFSWCRAWSRSVLEPRALQWEPSPTCVMLQVKEVQNKCSSQPSAMLSVASVPLYWGTGRRSMLLQWCCSTTVMCCCEHWTQAFLYTKVCCDAMPSCTVAVCLQTSTVWRLLRTNLRIVCCCVFCI